MNWVGWDWVGWSGISAHIPTQRAEPTQRTEPTQFLRGLR